MKQRSFSRQPAHGNYIHGLPCECGKRGYRDRDDAKAVVKEMRRRGKTRSDRVDTYECQVDPRYWHVGHRSHNAGRVNLNDPQVYDDEVAS